MRGLNSQVIEDREIKYLVVIPIQCEVAHILIPLNPRHLLQVGRAAQRSGSP